MFPDSFKRSVDIIFWKSDLPNTRYISKFFATFFKHHDCFFKSQTALKQSNLVNNILACTQASVALFILRRCDKKC